MKNTVKVSGILLDPDTITSAVGAYVYVKDVYPRLSSNKVGADGMYTIEVPKNVGEIRLVAEDAEPNSGKEWYPTIDGEALMVADKDVTGLITHVCPIDVLLPVLERITSTPTGGFIKAGMIFGPMLSGTPPNVTPIADVKITLKNQQGADKSMGIVYPAWVFNKDRVPTDPSKAALVIAPPNECEVFWKPGCKTVCMDVKKPETCYVTDNKACTAATQDVDCPSKTCLAANVCLAEWAGRTTTNEGGIWAAVNGDGSLTGNVTVTPTKAGTNFRSDIKSVVIPGFSTFIPLFSQ